MILSLAVLLLVTPASSTVPPFDGERWVAVVVQDVAGKHLTTTLKGTATKGSNAVEVEVTCAGTDAGGKSVTVSGKGQAMDSQGDFEGDVAGIGTFGIDSPDGKSLQWFRNDASCASGKVEWRRP